MSDTFDGVNFVCDCGSGKPGDPFKATSGRHSHMADALDCVPQEALVLSSTLRVRRVGGQTGTPANWLLYNSA